MKQIQTFLLTMMCMAGITMSCRSLSHNTMKLRTYDTERQRKTTADSTGVHTADSVLVWVERGDSVVRIIEKEVHVREKVKVVKDTVFVFSKTDSIVKTESAQNETSHSPPHWKLYLALTLLTIALAAIILQTIKKHLHL